MRAPSAKRERFEHRCRFATAWRFVIGVVLAAGPVGCASLTNPVADGVPVHALPPELLGTPKVIGETIPLNMLRQPPAEVYRLAAGDVLGVWIEGILGDRNLPPPVHYSDRSGLPPALGFPIPLREKGVVSLPQIKPLTLDGLSIADAEQAIRKAYTVDAKILNPNQGIVVTLLSPRKYSVLVIRQDSSNSVSVSSVGPLGGTQVNSSSKRGTGNVIELPAYENDVLHALAKTGGLPGLDAKNDVEIIRGAYKPGSEAADPQMLAQQYGNCRVAADSSQIVRIPLRVPPGQPPSFKPADVILRTGDIVFIEARDPELFYSAGLLPAGEHLLPRDYDLDVVEAITRIRGPLINGGFNTSSLSGAIVQPGLGGPSPSLLAVLRKTEGGGEVRIRVDLNCALRDPRERILVQPGDILILQETPGEGIGRYFSEMIKYNFIALVPNRQDAIGTFSATVP